MPGKYAIHNTNYWKGIPYLGIGPSAHGFDGYNRYINIANNAKYLSLLADNNLAETVEELSQTDRFNEYIMTSLRTMWGLDLQKIASDFGKLFETETRKQMKLFVEKGQLTLDGSIIKLTAEGKLFADGIAAELFVDDDLN